MPVASAMRTMRSKFEATPAASTIASGPCGTPLSRSSSASALTSARLPLSSLLARSSQAWALVQ